LACLYLAGCIKGAKQYIDRGNQLFAAGKYADATLNYRNAIQKSPNSGEAYYRLGLSLLKQGQGVEAYQAFNHAVTLDPKNMPAKVQLGELAFAIYARDPKHPAVLYNQAHSIADQLLGPGGDRVEGLKLKSALALVDRQPGAAVDSMREAVKLAPDNPEVAGELAQALLRDNQPEEAEKVALQSLEHDPKYAQGYELLYSLYISQQNWGKAESILKTWAAKNPDQSAPVLRLAGFYYARKQVDDSEKTLDSLLNHRDRFPQADMLVGDFHLRTRNLEKALADYQRGESRDHTRQEAYQERVASTLVTLGRSDEALKAADAILTKSPKNQTARALKVEVLDKIGGVENVKTAATLAADLAQESPGNPRVQLLAGQAFLSAGNFNEATQHLQRAAQVDPRSIAAQLALARLALVQKKYPEVLQHADAALAIRANDNEARLLRVIGLTGTHAYASAKTEAEQLAHDTKDAPQVEMQLGIIDLGQGRYADAEQMFRKVYKEKPNDLQSLAGLVNTYEAERMPDKALALMKEETGRAPDSKSKEALLVATAEADGKNDVALSELQKMAAENPKSAEVQLRIGALEQKTGHPEQALQAFQHAQQLAPDRKGIDAVVANIEDQMGKKTEAVASYRKALAKSPDDPVLLNNLAFLIADSGGDTKEALEMISTAIRKKPDLPQLRDTLAWIQLKAQHAPEAVSILRPLTTKYPNDTMFRYHYAVALNATGDRAAAKEQAQSALSRNPTPQLAGQIRGLLAQVK
jgi:tetratricopeptide (TPR) repeat protein